MDDKHEISDELTNELSFKFFNFMNGDDSWIKQYEEETGKSAFESVEKAV